VQDDKVTASKEMNGPPGQQVVCLRIHLQQNKRIASNAQRAHRRACLSFILRDRA
jgi:hypothetical protein